jgi:hypothetical protein
MNYTKSMIDLIKEIRRRVNTEIKPTIKMANPDLFSELAQLSRTTKDVITQALIKELFQLAGEPWASQLQNPDQPQERQVVKTYRGQNQLVSAPRTNQAKKSEPKKTQRIYRGHVVNTTE